MRMRTSADPLRRPRPSLQRPPDEPKHLLAIDAGGTRTRAVVLTAKGKCLGFGQAAAGNATSAGTAAAAAALAASTTQALTASATQADGIGHVTVAAAGAIDATSAAVCEALARIGIHARPHVESDALAVYHSGSIEPNGYALIAGTGTIAIRVERQRIVALSDALGWLLGDEGSGFWIGHQVVRAVLAALQGRADGTVLSEMLLGRLKIPRDQTRHQGHRGEVQTLMSCLYASRPVRLADFADLAFAAGSDLVAEAITGAAAQALARTLRSVAQPAMSGAIVVSGGVLVNNPEFVSRVSAELSARGIQAPITCVPDGLLGAAVLALREAGVTVDPALFDRLRSSLVNARGTLSR
jgi:N-acetylglucosamine kinase-like BadF-type ATPase